jgi:hypothetical protein
MTKEVRICDECGYDITENGSIVDIPSCDWNCLCHKSAIKNIDEAIKTVGLRLKLRYGYELLQEWNELERNKKHNFREI